MTAEHVAAEQVAVEDEAVEDEAADGAAARAELVAVAWDDPAAVSLRTQQQAELAALYDSGGDLVQNLPTEEMLATVVALVDGVPVACGSVRDALTYGDGYGELKRMYVAPSHRGRGLSRVVLRELERIASDAGLRRLVLETGDQQTAAIGLYRSAGYSPYPRYGPYVDEESSLCFARWLTP